MRAENNSSFSIYTTNNLTIDTTQNLSQQSIILYLPSDNKYSNVYQQNFTWQTMPFATLYRFEVLDTLGQLLFSGSLNNNSTNYTFDAEGTYSWRVSGQNDFSPSPFSTRKIFIDLTPPAQPVLLLPLNNDSVSLPVLLTWQNQIGVNLDSIFIYADTNLTQLVESNFTSFSQYEYSNGALNQDYFWLVKSKDAAGNWGTVSGKRKFIIAE